MKNFSCPFSLSFLVFFTFLSPVISLAQSSSQPLSKSENPHTIYRIFLGNALPGEDLSAYTHLEDLGFLSVETPTVSDSAAAFRSQGIQSVLIGPYLSQQTATSMLLLIWARGHKNAYIKVGKESQFTDAIVSPTLTIQLGAFSKLDIRKFSHLAELSEEPLYIKFEGGYFKVFLGNYSTDQEEHLNKNIIPYLEDKGYDPFVRSFK